MRKTLGNPEVTPAVRSSRPGWRDPRMWIGIVIVAASVVAGARLLAAADDSVEVWAVSGELAAGDSVTAADLVAHRVRFVDAADADRYLPATEQLPADAFVTRQMGAGELLPRSALDAGTDTGLTTLSIGLPGINVPPGLRPGNRVDVWSGQGKGVQAPLVEGAVVLELPAGGEQEFGAGDVERAVVIGLADADADQVGRVAAADQQNSLYISVRG